MFC
jgi:hypothetical protein